MFDGIGDAANISQLIEVSSARPSARPTGHKFGPEGGVPRKTTKKTTRPKATARPGDRLRRLRKAKGFTQVELAEAIGTSQPMVALYERHDAIPGPHILLKLCEVLDATPEQILGLEQSRSPKVPDSPENLRLWRKLKQVEKLSPQERRDVVRFIEALVERSVLKREKAS